MEPLLILLSITFTLVAFGLVVLVPILTWARSHRLERELKDLRARLAALEESISATRAATVDKPAAPAAPQVPTAELKFGPTYPQGPDAPNAPIAPIAPVAPAIDLPPLPAPEAPETLEAAIGGKVMLWVGTIVLVLGLAFFLKYAFDNDWINEPVRVGLGVIAGLALVWAGHRFVTSGYRAYGQILTGGGLAVMYLAIYAAFSYYELIGRTPAFVLLVAVTVGAAWLADRQNAIGLALMGVGGGFATPFLFSSGVDAQVTLFSYDALLGVGTLYLARRRDWPVLNLVSFAFTWFTIGVWADRFYSPEKWRRTEFFLTLFCALFLVILVEQLKRHRWRSLVSLVLALGPVIYHLSSLAILSGHGVAPLVYLIAVTLAAVAASVRAESARWRLVAWGAVIPPLLAWISGHSSPRWLMASLVASVAIYALHLLAQLDAIFRHDRTLSRLDGVQLHLNGYALMAAVYLALENVAMAWAPTATLAIGAVHGGLAWWLRGPDRRASLHALAVALGAVTIACALRLDGPSLTVALAIEGAFVVALGLTIGELWFRLGGAGLLVFAVMRYFGLSLPAKPTVFALFQDEPFAVGVFLALVLYGVALVYRRHDQETLFEKRSGMTLAVLGASALLVVALSAESQLYWDLRGDYSADARFAASLMLSFVWTICAAAFIAVGLRRNYVPIRYLAIVLFGITVVKVFLVDLSVLGGIYRILGFMGVGLALLAVSFLYQRSKKKPK
ncbi:MAG TPA: DUF2339 domain-containing protein [Vicinamibacterales bacterium]|nr:DUF2339 domain-containing protein [Vicinamibacterales bacterium]